MLTATVPAIGFIYLVYKVFLGTNVQKCVYQNIFTAMIEKWNCFSFWWSRFLNQSCHDSIKLKMQSQILNFLNKIETST